MVNKRPDNVPDNYSENAHILPYGSNVSAPSISLPDVPLFKTERGVNAANFFQQKIDEIQDQYNRLINLANDTELVYNSSYSFIPKVGSTYHLYDNNDNLFLSIISPDEWQGCEHRFVGSFLFTTDNTWQRVYG